MAHCLLSQVLLEHSHSQSLAAFTLQKYCLIVGTETKDHMDHMALYRKEFASLRSTSLLWLFF